MNDLKLNSVRLRNWVKFGDAKVQFPEKGLVMVTGNNVASGGKLLSVGAGKTSFGEAIGRAVFGIKGSSTIKEYSTDEAGDTYVRVTATLMGKPLIIELGYKCPEMSKTGEALRFTYGDNPPVERGLIEQTRQELVAMIGVSPLLAEWSAFVDGDALKFNRLSQQEQVELILAAMKQPPWNVYHERSRKTLSSFKKVVAKETGTLEQLQQQVISAEEDVYAAKSALEKTRSEYEQSRSGVDKQIAEKEEAIRTRQEAIQAADERQKAIANEVQNVNTAKAEAHHNLEIEYNKARDVIFGMRQDSRKLLTELHAAKSVTAVANEAYRVLNNVPKVCPTCRKPWDEKVDPADLAARLAELQAAQKTETGAQKRYDLNEEQIEVYSAAAETITEKIAALGLQHNTINLSNEHEGLSRAINRNLTGIRELQTEIQELSAEVTDAAVKQAEATLAERWRVLENTKQKLEATSKSLADSHAALKIMEYWTTAFSPAGIPNMVLQDSVAPLNHEARRVSEMMTGGTIDVKFSTRKTLVSGEQKPELVVEVDNRLGSNKIKRNSKGEGGLTNFVIAETLSNVGQVAQRIGFRWYDEVVPHQDPVVCRSIYSYMREIAHTLNVLIFIVDHNPAAANYADYFLQVEKQGDQKACQSVVRWG